MRKADTELTVLTQGQAISTGVKVKALSGISTTVIER